MEVAKVPKFDWKRLDEPNCGHTKNEWGLNGEEIIPDKILVIEAYTVVWNNQRLENHVKNDIRKKCP